MSSCAWAPAIPPAVASASAIALGCLAPMLKTLRRRATRLQSVIVRSLAISANASVSVPPQRRNLQLGLLYERAASKIFLEQAMSIPKPVYNPPFNITRASHSVLTVKDLAVSRNFYVDLLGFIVSDEDKDTLFLRGVAEACHHSLVIKQTRGEAEAERVGMRVFSEEDLDKAKVFFDKSGLPAKWVEVAASGTHAACLGRERRADRAWRPWISNRAWWLPSSSIAGLFRSGIDHFSCSCPTCAKRASSG